MSVIDRIKSTPVTRAPAVPEATDAVETGAEEPSRGRLPSGWLAGLRFATGFIFLWAFLDKTFGFGYATPNGQGWTDGGSPTEGFLSHVAVGPFQSTFHHWAGDTWADWLFMIGLAAIGIAVIAGIGLRIAAVSGTLMMALMWAAEWPLAKHTSAGAPSGSVNPLVDYHVIYALALIVIAVYHGGDRWGLGRPWSRLPLVHRHPEILK
jgi:thiosulfate dehydrogenase [quinone] large subunit